MIEVSLFGTGSPIVDPDRAGPSTLVRCGSHLFLVDCGRGALLRAAAVGVGAADLTALLLTHLHSDHITDLNDVIITRWITTLQSTPLPIIGPQGTAQVVYATLAALGPDIRYRMVHHPDLTEPPAPHVHEHTEGLVWNSGGVRILVAPTDHRPAEPTIAFRIGYEKASVVLAGDSLPYSALDGLAAGADALVRTAVRNDLIGRMPHQRIKDILDYHSSVEQAAQTAAKAGVDTLVLTHYVPPIARGQEEEWRQHAASVFDGRIELGDDLHRVEINAPV